MSRSPSSSDKNSSTPPTKNESPPPISTHSATGSATDSSPNATTTPSQNASKFIWFISLLTLLLCLGFSEWFLRSVYHLGDPVLYQRNPLYGYRPLENQHLTRFNNARITFNNLGLRTQDNWDDSKENKLLFLGDSVTYGGSYIDDSQLTTAIVNQAFSDLKVGNGGFNGWGVDNIAGLLGDAQFQPAHYYVFLLLETDFYRTINGGIGWTQKPTFALQELITHYLELWISKTKYASPTPPSENDYQIVMKNSVQNLKNIIHELNQKGDKTLILITPRKTQLLGELSKDTRLADALNQAKLSVIYLEDQPELNTLSQDEINDVYHDHVHLTQKGHTVWAKVITRLIKTEFLGLSRNI